MKFKKLSLNQTAVLDGTGRFESKKSPVPVKRMQRKDSMRTELIERTNSPDLPPQHSNMQTDQERLSNIYTGLEEEADNTVVKKTTFGNFYGFMANRNRNFGHVNPAFEHEDDVTDDDTEDHYCNSDSEESSESRTYSDRESTASSTSQTSKKQIPNGRVVNSGRDFKVGMDAVRERSHPPPDRSNPTQPAKPKEKKAWDRFETTSKDNFSSDDKKFWDKVFVVTKIVVASILFLFTLGTAVISKTCFIIITTNMLVPSKMTALVPLKTANGTIVYYKDQLSFSDHPGQTNVQWIWAMTLMIGTPYVFTVFRNVWKIWFQFASRGSPTWSAIFLVLLLESLHSVGLLLTVFVVVPNMDPISGILMTLCIGLVPSVLKMIYPTTQKEDLKTKSKLWYHVGYLLGIIGALGQLFAIGIWCYHIYSISVSKFKSILPYLVCMIIAPILTSIQWWENFVYKGKKGSSGLPLLTRHITKYRTKLTFYSSIWKMILTIIIPMALFGASCDHKGDCVDVLYFKKGKANITTDIITTTLVSSKDFGHCSSYLPIIIAAIGALSSGICFKVGKIGCRIMTQAVDYSLPLALSTPVTVAVIFGMFSGFITTEDTGCSIPFARWTENGTDAYFQAFTQGYKQWLHVIAGVVGFCSMLLVTSYIWFPSNVRLQKTDKLFVQPLYSGIFTDIALMLNRRRIEKVKDTTVKKTVKEQRLYLDENINLQEKTIFSDKDTPVIYMCATMWHENENEMIQLLKSVFRMDEDQCTRKNAMYFINRRDPDYYEFEAHIFFDDAFEKHKDDQYDFTINEHVKLLIKTVQFSASAIHDTNYKIKPPTKIGTPYGGRLVWKLPGGNTLVAHLKDKAVIRHRKRWSQVMYMYYFLAHKLFKDQEDDKPSKAMRRKLHKRASNTFILALDGDVDFYPNAVQLLVDRMKKNPGVGAACGRIHPIGNGAMVWYQKFEYAISHWLQKAAEDKLGCVLCSPGCFSLFRGSALMDDNVMNKYTTPPTEPRHHVQYDQGEDRWLCTLLLQQGHRVEYCAASDALTYAPEEFFEFYKQRRRWLPSTMANIMDLLTDWKNVTEKNQEISLLYVCYQALLMVSSILTPGTIFLMILGAINMAYPDINLWWALVINLIPIGVMVLLCFTVNDQKQLTYAAILSTAYSLIMMIVIVGLLVQAAKFGICSVTTVFITFVGGVFVLSALIHPQEFWCIIHGFLYFLSIPSMSMILMIYSLGNLHVVTWGTRENKVTAEGLEQKKKKKDKLPGFLKRFERFLPGSGDHPEDDKLHAILDRLDGIEMQISQLSEHGSRFSGRNSIDRRSATSSVIPYMAGEGNNEKFSQINNFLSGAGERENPLFTPDKQVPRDRLKDPYWIKEDQHMQYCRQDMLNKQEVKFWEELIEEYLKPLDANPEKQAVMAAELIELRNKVCLIFILINSLFIIIVFTLQEVVASGGSLSILLPCADPKADKETLLGQSIEPISVAFTLVFGILLFVQFICMLMHRQATLLHICAATEIFKKKRKLTVPGQVETGTEEDKPEYTYQEVYEMVKDMQKDQEVDSVSVSSEISAVSDLDDEEFDTHRREEAKSRWKRIAKSRGKVTHNTLHANFMKNMETVQRVVSSKNDEVSSQEADDDIIAERLKKETKFNRFRNKSLHVLATMTRDKSMRDQLAQKKTQLGAKNFQLAARKIVGLKKVSQVVEAAKALKERDEKRKEMEEIEMEKRLTNPAVEEDDIDGTEQTSLKERSNIEETQDINSVRADGSENQDDGQGTRTNSRNLSDEEFQIHITTPKVEDDYWPDETEYVKEEQKEEAAAFGDAFDTFF